MNMRKTIMPLMLCVVFAACSNADKTTTVEPAKKDTIAITQEEKKDTEMPLENQKEVIVKISTSYGDMLVKLYNETPKHRDYFIKLTKEGFYNDLLFHRVMNDFMIQGGDPDSRNAKAGAALGSGGPGYTVPAEFRPNLFHKKGALAAARQPDQVNPTKASSGSQFYIVDGKPTSEGELNSIGQQMGITFSPEQIKTYTTIGGTPFLDQNYTVFGEVISGMEVIDKIAVVQTDERDRPKKDIKMQVSIQE